jgi:hypothetical protein
MSAGNQCWGLWTQLMTAYRMAQVARDTMRSPTVGQQARDDATRVLVTQTNRLMDMMEAMSEQGVLVAIQSMLAARGQ